MRVSICPLCRSTSLLLLVVICVFHGSSISCGQSNRPSEEPASPSLMATGRMIAPAGSLLDHYGRPVDMELSYDGKILFVKAHTELWVVDAVEDKLIQAVPIPDGASLYGMSATPSNRVYVTNSKNLLLVYSYSENAEPKLKLDYQIELEQDSFPCGIVVTDDEKRAYICLSKLNSVAVVDLEAKSVARQIPVGVAPFDLTMTTDRKLVVSNLGGRRAQEGDKTATSGGTATVIDQRGIASTGTLSVIDLEQDQVEADISVGLHPSTICLFGNQAIVCNTNEDTISFVNLENRQVTNFDVKPDADLPFGSMPSAVVMSPDQQLMFVALAGNNAIAVIDVADSSKPKTMGLVPAAWYPASLACSATHLFVGNIKGIGARSPRRDIKEGWNSHDHRGLVQKVRVGRNFRFGDSRKVDEIGARELADPPDFAGDGESGCRGCCPDRANSTAAGAAERFPACHLRDQGESYV